MSERGEANELATRALGWVHGLQAGVCDVVEPWEHGTVVRATRYPTYFDYNTVRVEEDPGMDVDALVAVADEKLVGLGHRRIDFDFASSADRLRGEFEVKGWKATRLIWLRHDGSTPAGDRVAVESVPYDEVFDLRVAWIKEDPDFASLDPIGHFEAAREVAMSRGAEVLAVRRAGTPIAFAQTQRAGDAAESSASSTCSPSIVDAGLGTSLTMASIDAARDIPEFWICADDEDRPKQLYMRLGFEPAVTMLELLRLM